jgi:hypothetical protein
MINIHEYYDSIVGDATLSANIEGTPIEINFLRSMLDKLVDYGEFNEYVINEDGSDASGLWRLDAYSIDDGSEASTGAISVFISLFNLNSDLSNLTKTELQNLIKKISKFIEFSLEKDIYRFFETGTCAFDAAVEIKKHWKDKASNVRIYILSNRQLSSRVSEIPRVEIHDTTIDVVLWDINRFFNLELSGREREVLEIDLSDRPIKALFASSENSKDIISMLAAIPATTLVDIYTKWGSRLLEQNVRSFLTAKVKVNKGIRDTIKNSPTKFFAFNNGITATAESVEYEEREDGTYITKINNFQIVNGGQTTASLFSASTKDKFDISQIYVQMKLSIVTASDAINLVPFISKYANTQNKVTDADLFSNHPFHIRFEGFSRNIISPQKIGAISGDMWFYERARGQYTNALANCSNKLERTKFAALNPRSQLISKTALAKFLNPFSLLPHIVSKGAEYNFAKFADSIAKQWEIEDETFNAGFFKISISKAIIFKSVEKLISYQKDTWYKGHRDKLVPYTISFIQNCLNNHQKFFNFDEIWLKQSTNSELDDLITVVAEIVNDILHDPDRPIGNIGEYAKRESCWTAVKLASDKFQLDRYFSIFIDANSFNEVELKNKVEQKRLSGKELMFKINSIEPNIWEAVRDFLVENSMINPDKAALIKQAIYKKPILSERQCRVLDSFLDEYNSNFRG